MLHKNNTFPYLDITNTTSSPLISSIIPLRHISYLYGISHTSMVYLIPHQIPSETIRLPQQLPLRHNSYLYTIRLPLCQ